MDDDDKQIREIVSLCFAELEQGRTSDEIIKDLMAQGLGFELATLLVAQAHTNLERYRAHKRSANLEGTNSSLTGGTILILIGIALAAYAGEAPGRFAGLYLTIIALGGWWLWFGISGKIIASKA